MELVRLALPRRVFTLSQIMYLMDRIRWLYENRNLIEGLEFYDEPKRLRFFFSKLKPVSDWQQKLYCQENQNDKGSLKRYSSANPSFPNHSWRWQSTKPNGPECG